MSKTLFRVAAKAFIRKGDAFLLLREADHRSSELGKYQIPGGGIEESENINKALAREVMEETGLEVDIITPFFVDGWEAHIDGEHRKIIAIFFLCDYKSGEIILSDEHDKFAWVKSAELKKYNVSHPVPLLFAKYNDLKDKNWGEL